MLINNIFNTNRNPDILECIANLSSDEVFTPPQVVQQILDALPSEVWSNPDLKFLDPACKTGVFLREIAKRLMMGLENVIPDESARREHIFKNMIYGIAITDLTGLMSRRSLYYSKYPDSKYSVIRMSEPQGNIVYSNIEHTFKNRRCIYCGSPQELLDRVETMERHAYQFIHQSIDKIFTNMKFDVIIGNPPYQLNSGGYGAQAIPIYQKFIEAAIALEPRYISMIIPSRWFAGGMGLSEFRAKMLSDKRMKVLVDYPNAEDCFPGVEIKGGVCYFLWDKTHNGECEVISMLGGEEVSRAKRALDEYDVFIRFNESIGIVNKIRSKNESTLDKKVSGVDPFKFPTNFTDFKKKSFSNSIKIYVNPSLGKVGYVDRSKITINIKWVDKYKVLLARASEGKGTYPNNIIGKPIIAEPNSCCTFTYLVIDTFDDKSKAENLAKYIKTRFFRFLVSLKKNTQDTNKDKFSFVPDLDMSQEWTDEKLYQRYDITEEEQAFIASIVKEMP